MTNLSSLTGFSSGGGGGGGEFTGTFIKDSNGYNLQDESSYLQDTNLNSYSQALRIRGLDNNNKAYVAFNCMTQTSPGGGNMRHTCTLFSLDQSSGNIQKEGVRHMHNNSSYHYDYSTMEKASDEWTGRYTYHGNIPHSNQSHTYSYHTCFLYGTGSGDYTSSHNNWSGYPNQNAITHSNYVAVAERRIGGAVKHNLNGYNSSSHAVIYEWGYGYSSSSLNMQYNGTEKATNSSTSTNYMVTLVNQWGTQTEPYYDAFHSMPDGIYARVRTSGSWQLLGSGYNRSESWIGYFLSNGAAVLNNQNKSYYINTSGQISAISPSNQNPAQSPALYNYAQFVVNIGEDEYLQFLPGGKVMKFKYNPLNGNVTYTSPLQVKDLEYSGYNAHGHYDSGFYSTFSPTTVNKAGCLFTFGNDNSNGYGYGTSKLVWIGGNSNSKTIQLATYDLSGLIAELTYT